MSQEREQEPNQNQVENLHYDNLNQQTDTDISTTSNQIGETDTNRAGSLTQAMKPSLREYDSDLSELDTVSDRGYSSRDGNSYDVGIDAVGLDGSNSGLTQDRSLSNNNSGASDYQDIRGSDRGPAGYFGMGDETNLQGGIGLADDTGMHIESGFSLGFEDEDFENDSEIDGDLGNSIQGGYTSLADAAGDIPEEELHD